jgi:hypothetical protein
MSDVSEFNINDIQLVCHIFDVFQIEENEYGIVDPDDEWQEVCNILVSDLEKMDNSNSFGRNLYKLKPNYNNNSVYLQTFDNHQEVGVMILPDNTLYKVVRTFGSNFNYLYIGDIWNIELGIGCGILYFRINT